MRNQRRQAPLTKKEAHDHAGLLQRKQRKSALERKDSTKEAKAAVQREGSGGTAENP